MSKESHLLRACDRIVRDEALIRELLDALEQAQVPLDQGQHYDGEVLEVAATVREAAAKARKRLGVRV